MNKIRVKKGISAIGRSVAVQYDCHIPFVMSNIDRFLTIVGRLLYNCDNCRFLTIDTATKFEN